jgi:hypothetical protein
MLMMPPLLMKLLMKLSPCKLEVYDSYAADLLFNCKLFTCENSSHSMQRCETSFHKLCCKGSYSLKEITDLKDKIKNKFLKKSQCSTS